jgi:DNA-binding response OmpR family regulator
MSGEMHTGQSKHPSLGSEWYSPRQSARRPTLSCAATGLGEDTAMNAAILLVDDDSLFVKSLTFLLKQEGYDVRAESSANDAIEAVRRSAPDLVLLDIGLPDLNGVEACRRLRQNWLGPIIMLTGRRHDTDKVLGLDAGADDYVVKPFVNSELLARIRAALRRAHQPAMPGAAVEQVTVGRLRLDPGARKVWVDGELAALSAREYDLLHLLAERSGHAVTRQFILDRIWGADFVGDLGALDVYIRALRKKIEPDPDRPTYIRTLRGVGYRLEAPPDDA